MRRRTKGCGYDIVELISEGKYGVQWGPFLWHWFHHAVSIKSCALNEPSRELCRHLFEQWCWSIWKVQMRGQSIISCIKTVKHTKTNGWKLMPCHKSIDGTLRHGSISRLFAGLIMTTRHCIQTRVRRQKRFGKWVHSKVPTTQFRGISNLSNN